MSPPNRQCDVSISPTYLSTELITPGRPLRETLPSIGIYEKSLDDYKLWGQETKQTSKGETLAYHHFKPSHLQPDNVIVTHRHYDNRISNIFEEAKEQPYGVTSLLLSKCRMNDQRLPPPFQSTLIQERFVPEPIPEYLRNSYFSHRCKFQVFPTDGVDLRDASIPPLTKIKKPRGTATMGVVNEIKGNLYNSTTYRHNFHISPPKLERLTKNTSRFKSDVEVCRKCAKLIKREKKKENMQEVDQKKPCWPMWPLGLKNITDSPPSVPRILLPKYCIHPIVRPKLESEKFCVCIQKVPVNIAEIMSCEDLFLLSHKRELEDETTNNTETETNEKDKIETKNIVSKAQLCDDSLSKEVPEKDKETEKKPCIDRKRSIFLKKSRSRMPISKRLSKFECGFKTEAHRKYHKLYDEAIPDLRDAKTEGRKHNFHGFNVHVFRG